MGANAATHAQRFTWEKAGEAFSQVIAGRLEAGQPELTDQRAP